MSSAHLEMVVCQFFWNIKSKNRTVIADDIVAMTWFKISRRLFLLNGYILSQPLIFQWMQQNEHTGGLSNKLG